MRVESVRCEGYKPFRDAVELDLAPLTLLFGHNTSGKSALVRLPRMALRALGGSLDLKIGDTRYGGSFLDLVHGRDKHGSMRLGLTLADAEQERRADATWQNLYTAERGNTHFVCRLKAEGDGSLDLQWDRSASPGSFTQSGPDPIPVLGMLPQRAVPGQDFDPSAWREAAEDALRRLVYLGPHRKNIEPSYAWRADAPLEEDGAGAPDWLRADAGLADAVADWYETHLGTRLEVEPQGEGYRLVIRDGSQVLNAVELGEGAQQILPVVTALHALMHSGLRTSLVVIEQPELHLHDAAQGAVADLLIRAAMKSVGPILVETHSELLLLRTRRRIAERSDRWKEFRAEDAAIYWVERRGVEACLRRMTVESDGWVKGWPRSVYDVTFQEVAALQRAASGELE